MKMLQVKGFFSTSIIYYNFLQTSILVCYHHLLSLVIVFTCLLGLVFSRCLGDGPLEETLWGGGRTKYRVHIRVREN